MKVLKDVLTTANFLAFARSKPPDEEFSYSDGKKCAVAQFLKSEGIPFYWVGGTTVMKSEREARSLDKQGPPIPWEIVDAIDGGAHRTFGAVVARLEKTLEEE